MLLTDSIHLLNYTLVYSALSCRHTSTSGRACTSSQLCTSAPCGGGGVRPIRPLRCSDSCCCWLETYHPWKRYVRACVCVRVSVIRPHHMQNTTAIFYFTFCHVVLCMSYSMLCRAVPCHFLHRGAILRSIAKLGAQTDRKRTRTHEGREVAKRVESWEWMRSRRKEWLSRDMCKR